MKVRVTFDIDRETREAIGFDNDRKLGRLATRDEIEGVIRDGAEYALANVGGGAYELAKRGAAQPGDDKPEGGKS